MSTKVVVVIVGGHFESAKHEIVQDHDPLKYFEMNIYILFINKYITNIYITGENDKKVIIYLICFSRSDT